MEKDAEKAMIEKQKEFQHDALLKLEDFTVELWGRVAVGKILQHEFRHRDLWDKYSMAIAYVHGLALRQARSEGYKEGQSDVECDRCFQNGWIEAIAAARKVIEKRAAQERMLGCDYVYPPSAFDEIAEVLSALKKEG